MERSGEDRPNGTARLIREARDAAGLTQRQLADAAGVSLGTLRDIEQGRTTYPGWRTVEDLAAAAEMSQSYRAELMSAGLAGSGGVPPRQAGQPADRSGTDGAVCVRIGVLGPLLVFRGHSQVTIRSARQRAILGLLALNRGAAVHRDTVIDMLWGECPPPSAVTAVQSYISQLRRLLDPAHGPGGGPLPRGDTVYRLADDVGLDLAEFATLTERAGQAASRGGQSGACELYERALRLWRGDVLADIGPLSDYPAAVELNRRRAEAVTRYAKAAELSGAHESVIPHLRALSARESLNEQAHALLMTSLSVTGQRAAALRVFEQLRRRLADELGIGPCALVVAAHDRILGERTEPDA